MAQADFDDFVGECRQYFDAGADINRETLKKAMEAVEVLSHIDESGQYIDEGQAFYKEKKNLGLLGDTLQYIKTKNPKLSEALDEIGGQAPFMRCGYNDMSYTVPVVFKGDMIEAEVGGLRKVKLLLDRIKGAKTTAEEEIEILKAENRKVFGEIRQKAAPYVNADITVAIEHFDNYQSLRRRLLEVGGRGERGLNCVGEQGAMLARKILSSIYSDEYQQLFEEYSQNPDLLPDLRARNRLVGAGSEIDEELK